MYFPRTSAYNAENSILIEASNHPPSNFYKFLKKNFMKQELSKFGFNRKQGMFWMGFIITKGFIIFELLPFHIFKILPKKILCNLNLMEDRIDGYNIPHRY